ncbi:MAG: transcription antitermination factor NusB [Candidatus Hatepunaea meridiana]|nr:transcription antitermination factor NusB [Candidatus Hatepunaea meridiana]
MTDSFLELKKTTGFISGSNIRNSKSRMPSRRLAREIALKVAYAIEVRSCEPEEALQDKLITDGELPPAYTVRLITHIEQYREQLDDLIRLKVDKWEFHRIAVLDRIILRMGIAELLYFPDVPPKVSINEAIEIAKLYSTDNSGRFVNGILDAVYNDITKGEIVLNGSSGKSS